MKRLFLAISLCMSGFQAHAQSVPDPVQTADKINTSVIMGSVSRLTSDSFAGRGTGQRGYELTVEYLSNELRTLGYDVLIQSFEVSDMKGNCVMQCTPGKDNTWNIIGVLHGKERRSVIYSAHADHIGIKAGQLHPGADDNASGVAAVLAIAKVISETAKSYHPQRTVIIAFWGAEELGLLGSKHFVTSPLYQAFPPVALINYDMVGRGPPDDMMVIGYPYASELASAQYPNIPIYDARDGKTKLRNPLLEMAAKANETYGLNFIPYEVHRKKFLRSDQFSFYRADPRNPTLFLHDGYEDGDYHGTGDIAEKLDFAKIRRAAQLGLAASLDLLYNDALPKCECTYKK